MQEAMSHVRETLNVTVVGIVTDNASNMVNMRAMINA